ncbi:MAG TPA: Wzt carbohydrate-binding domain-containing protein, partial [Chthonomonadaceae bacterium]|nr:Wzt carbohydrate-binding domain-containing protein [Chthonomonadaceae bacterium]
YVRLAFAVAAHLNTDILVVDEVLAVGDAEFQKKCLGKMDAVAKQGRTVLLVSHNMSIIHQLCTRVMLFRSGCLERDGEPGEIVSHYFNDTLYATEGDFDLSEHAARLKTYTPIIKRVRLYNDAGNATASFEPDSSLTVEMFIEPVRPISKPRAAVAVEDHYGRRIFTVASYFQAPLEDITDPCRLCCTIPRLALGTGRYLLSVSIGDSYSGLLDSIDCAASFTIEWRNNYGNGEPFHQVYGPVLTESLWERLPPANLSLPIPALSSTVEK